MLGETLGLIEREILGLAEGEIDGDSEADPATAPSVQSSST